jgi:D-alanyl-D-alanine carboxypeptidase/D-alanyl-D-alanine-endopeptidase (penicillin-binding protein 4)
MKLFVTAAALDAIGPDERPRTTVETAARIDRLGRVLGDVHLVGRGDPTLRARPAEGRPTPALEALADALRDAGIQRIEGRLVGNESYFQGPRRGPDWGWDDLVWWYGAEVSALSFNDNTATLRISPGEAVGDPALVERVPLSAYYTLDAEVRTTPEGSDPDLRLSRELGANRIRLSGGVPLGAPTRTLAVALEDPALYAATVFEELLRARGIVVTRGVETSSRPLPARTVVLASHDGPPLGELVAGINKSSQNLHAEMLLRLLGARVQGAGTTEAGRDAVLGFLRRAGLSVGGLDLRDASGLSRAGVVTPAQIAALLVFMSRHPQAAAFTASLPVAGTDGNLRNRLRGAPTEGAVTAKTGTLTHVHALAGYATCRDGDRLAFAILLNQYTGDPSVAQAAIDFIVKALVE